MITISGDDALAEFRASLTGRSGPGPGPPARRPRPGPAAGRGRQVPLARRRSPSRRVEGGDYDLVVVLCPTRRLIRERRPLQEPPPGVKVVDLRPRPAERCGPERDAQWRRFEANDLAALGRLALCKRCPHLRACFWPDQYGKGLEGARIIYATQAHLARSPGFLVTLRVRTGAERMLTLFDEAEFHRVARRVDDAGPGPRTIPRGARGGGRPDHGARVESPPVAGHGRDAPGGIHRGPPGRRWRFPYVHSEWAAAVQRVGVERHGYDFRFLGFALNHLGFSPIETRRRDDAGDVQFANRPYVGDCIVFSGTTDPDFARHRLGRDLASPFADHRFIHPQTRWYNLASRIGSRRYFPRHAAPGPGLLRRADRPPRGRGQAGPPGRQEVLRPALRRRAGRAVRPDGGRPRGRHLGLDGRIAGRPAGRCP